MVAGHQGAQPSFTGARRSEPQLRLDRGARRSVSRGAGRSAARGAALRHKAQAAGKLAASGAQLVINDGDTILIEPADPRRVSMPGGKAYDIATFERFDWGWHSWALDWRHRAVMYQDAPLLAKAD